MFRDSREKLNGRSNEAENRVLVRGKFECEGVTGTYTVRSVGGSRFSVRLTVLYDEESAFWLDKSYVERRIRGFFEEKLFRYRIAEWSIRPDPQS